MEIIKDTGIATPSALCNEALELSTLRNCNPVIRPYDQARNDVILDMLTVICQDAQLEPEDGAWTFYGTDSDGDEWTVTVGALL